MAPHCSDAARSPYPIHALKRRSVWRDSSATTAHSPGACSAGWALPSEMSTTCVRRCSSQCTAASRRSRGALRLSPGSTESACAPRPTTAGAPPITAKWQPKPTRARFDSNQEDDAALREARATLDRILDGLDDDKRAVFVLFEIEELPMTEVAMAVGCPLQTAYSRLHAARREVEAAMHRLRAKQGGR